MSITRVEGQPFKCDACGGLVEGLRADVAFTSTHDTKPEALLILCKRNRCNVKRDAPQASWPLAELDLRLLADMAQTGPGAWVRLTSEQWRRFICMVADVEILKTSANK